MGEYSKISWCDSTWNPIRGCSRMSSGCKSCYAERMASRFAGSGQPYEGVAEGGRWTGRVELVPERLGIPAAWRRPRRIFVCSMSDPFHESLEDEAIARVFGAMAETPRHTYLVLTKRSGRMRARLQQWATRRERGGVWMGVSAENQVAADMRIPDLLASPAAVRWVSAEPLLGPLDLRPWLGVPGGLDWVVVGGESGPGARPMHGDWARGVRDQCAAAGAAFFFKQWGEWAPWVEDGDQRYSEGMFWTYGGGAVMRGQDYAGISGLGRGVNPFRESVVRVGKKAAGDLLDGRQHHAFPPGVTDDR